MNRVFIADLHLDSSTPEKLFTLRRVLTDAVHQECSIYILGDLVETWIGDDDNSEFANQLRMVLRTHAVQVPMFLMHGNRDFLIGERFASDVGATILDDPTVIEVQHERVLLSHGDMFCTSDYAYQDIRKKFRSAQWQQDFLAKSLSERRQLATKMRMQSKEAVAEKSDYITDVAEDAIVAALQSFDCRTMIHGHTHRPGQHRMARGYTRYVLGDWGRCGWRIHSSPQIQLECFPVRGVTQS